MGVSFLVTTRGHVLKVVARDEDKDAWRSYLARHDFARALSHCRTASQRRRCTALRLSARVGRERRGKGGEVLRQGWRFHRRRRRREYL